MSNNNVSFYMVKCEVFQRVVVLDRRKIVLFLPQLYVDNATPTRVVFFLGH